MAAENLKQLDHHRVIWDIANVGDIGETDDVQVEQGVQFFPIKVKSLGAKKLGEKVVAADAVVTVQAREITPAMRRSLTPWAPPTGGIPALPPSNTDLYDYAKLLTLHPTDAGASTDRDLNFVKACPWVGPEKLDGEGNTVREVKFFCYFDRDDLPNNTIWYEGPVPV